MPTSGTTSVAPGSVLALKGTVVTLGGFVVVGNVFEWVAGNLQHIPGLFSSCIRLGMASISLAHVSAIFHSTRLEELVHELPSSRFGRFEINWNRCAWIDINWHSASVESSKKRQGKVARQATRTTLQESQPRGRTALWRRVSSIRASLR